MIKLTSHRFLRIERGKPTFLKEKSKIASQKSRGKKKSNQKKKINQRRGFNVF